MSEQSSFEMIAKTFQGLEEILAQELTELGADNIEIGRRMVSFTGDKTMLYKANFCLRTAIRILKPLKHFTAHDADEVYNEVKAIRWEDYLTTDKSFAVDAVVFSEEFRHSKFVSYRVKDAIVDYFREKTGKRPNVRINKPDVLLNIHIAENTCTLSLDSSGESLHRRGYRQEAVEAPLNEVLAAGMILMTGWRGECDLIDPMCGSGTIPIEAALIARNIAPGVFRQEFAFEKWPDFDRELFESIYNDDSAEREIPFKIYGADVDPRAIAIAERNIKSAGVGRFIELERKALVQWTEAPDEGFPGIMVTNPPYGQRIRVEDMEGLYGLLGTKLKNVFKGYHAWIIGYRDDYFNKIGLAPSVKLPTLNGSLECELREYVIFEGNYDSFRASGGSLRTEASVEKAEREERKRADRRKKSFKDFKDFKDLKGSKDFKRSKKKPRRDFDDEESENPLAKRRNPHALKDIIGRKPKLGDSAGRQTVMRPRRGWKRPGGDNSSDR